VIVPVVLCALLLCQPIDTTAKITKQALVILLSMTSHSLLTG
jgi:hypothetical protein